MNTSKESLYATELNKDIQQLVYKYCETMTENGVEYPGNVVANALGSALASIGYNMAGKDDMEMFVDCLLRRYRDMQRTLIGEGDGSIKVVYESSISTREH